MAIFGIVDEISEAQGLKHTFRKAAENAGPDYYSGVGEETYTDQQTLNKIYENMVWVYRCVNILATNMAATPLKVYRTRQNEKIDITDEAPYAILHKPNRFQTKYDFWYESIVRLETQGELFWEKSYAGSKLVSVYADWRSEQVQIVPDKDAYIKQFVRMINGKSIPFNREEVFYLKYINPLSSHRGLSPLKAGYNSVVIELNSQNFVKKFFNQGLKLSGIIESPTQLQQAEARRMKQDFERLYGGVDSMHKIGMLWGGFKFSPTQMTSLKDMQATDLRKLDREEIAAIYGIPLELLGIGKTTYQNMQYARRSLWTETIQPKMKKIIDTLNADFKLELTKDPSVVIEADYSNVEALKEDLKQKSEIYAQAVKLGVLSRNEMRVDVFNKDADDSEGMDIPSITEPKEYEKSVNNYFDVKTLEDRAAIWRKEIKRINTHEQAFKRHMVDFFTEQKGRVLRAINHFVRKDLAKIHLTSENVLFDLEDEKVRLIKEGTPWIFDAVKTAVDEMRSVLHAGSFDYELPSVRAALGQRVLKFSHFVNTTTDHQIKKVVQDVLQETAGQGIPVIKEALKERVSTLFNDFTDARAASIARTEAVGASNMGLQESMVQFKVNNKMWITSRDDRVRDTHQIDGQVVGVNELFQLQDGSEMLYPMDFNERCIQIPTTRPKTLVREEVKPAVDVLDYKESSDMGRLYDGMYQLKWDKWAKTLTEEQKAAFHLYKHNGYVDINTGLRGDKDFSDEIWKAIKAMDADFTSKLTKDTVVYRGIGKDTRLYKSMKNGNLVGCNVWDEAFVSTSLDIRTAGRSFALESETICQIKLPKGTRVAFPDKVSDMSEFEILLQRGPEFQVTNISQFTTEVDEEMGDITFNIIEMELTP